jgi:RimJ/RimL family protein N-acetyltransferase
VTEDSEYLVEGDRVALGPLRPDLADEYVRWMNRLEVRPGMSFFGILGTKPEEAWIDEMVQANATHQPERADFTIHDRRDGAPVGTSGLFDINHHHARARFGILLGERRGEGLGSEAARLTLDWAFNVLSLRNVLLEVLPWNAAAIRAYEKAGFKLVGRRRDAILAFGRRWDEVYMDAVADEFDGSVLTGRLPRGE